MDEGGVHLNHEDKLFLTITEVLDGLPWSKVIEFAITSIEQTTDEPYPIDPVRTAVDMRLLQVCAMHSTDPFSDDIRVLMERLREKLWHTPTFSSATRGDDSEGEIDEMAVLVEEADIASIQRLLGGAPSEIPVQPSTRKQLPEKGLDEDELTRLLLAIEQSENPLEAVVGALLLDSGMRISELCSLNVTHIDYQDLCGLIDGDGPSTRLVFLSERVRPALNAWLEQRKSQLKGDEQALFIDADGKRLTAANADKLLESLADAAKMERGRLTAYTLRNEKQVLDRVRPPEPMTVERQDDSDSPSEGVMLMTGELRDRLLESLNLTEELIVEVLIPVPAVVPEQSEQHFEVDPKKGLITQISENLSPKQIENILQIGSERPSAMASMESATASIEELISRQVYVGDRLVGTIVGERHHPDQGVDTMRLKVEPDVAEEYMRKPAEFAPLPKELIHSIKKDGSVKLSRSMRELQRRWRNACKISEQLYSPDELLGRAVIDNQGTEIGTVSALVKVKRTFRGLLVEVRTNVARSHGLGQTIRIPIPAISHSRSPNVLIISMTLDKLLTMPNYLQLNERRGDGSYFAWTDNPAVGDWEPSLEERVTSLVEHYSLRKKK